MTKQYQKMDGQKIKTTLQICGVDGCNDYANRVSAGMCEKHYMRQRRRGTTDKYKRPDKISHSHGYVLISADRHDLMKGKPAGSRLYEHRVLFYDTYGGGMHKCNWCDNVISFDEMHVDHVNAIKDDNRIDNLVASCPTCNRSRGSEKMIKTKRKNGINIKHNGVTKHVSEWADDLNISSVSLKWRLNNGWSAEDAVTTPRGKFGPKKASNAT